MLCKRRGASQARLPGLRFLWAGLKEAEDAVRPADVVRELVQPLEAAAPALAAAELGSGGDGGGDRARRGPADVPKAVALRQREDGSWVNEEKKWLEGDPNIVTAYALLALSYCKKK